MSFLDKLFNILCQTSSEHKAFLPPEKLVKCRKRFSKDSKTFLCLCLIILLFIRQPIVNWILTLTLLKTAKCANNFHFGYKKLVSFDNENIG